MLLRSWARSLNRWLWAQRSITPLRHKQSSFDAVRLPVLSAETSYDTSKPISEEELYKYSNDRWIVNESEKLSEKYLRFNLRELLKAAVTVTSCEGARYCTRVLKCDEGINNKAYILTMDNGSEIMAKLPNPVAGPTYYITASEVATREFLRDACNVPIPRILAWSADQNNPVGAEYILEEKAPGKLLGSVWDQWPLKSKFKLIDQIIEIERRLASTKFIKSGCIYFKNDIPGDLSSGDILINSPSLNASVVERFTMGPLVSSKLWCGVRAGMDMNRGPYSGPFEFAEAMAANEIRFIKRHARPRMNSYRSLTEPELPEEALELLDRYLKLVPSMVPPCGIDDIHSPTLWHQDLHLNNIFVDPESKEITRIIDWQSTTALPLFYQSGVPKMFQYSGPFNNNWEITERPNDYDSLDEAEQARINSDQSSETCYKYYLGMTGKLNQRHWAVLSLKNINLRTQPSRLVVNVWKDRNVFALRHSLLSIVQQWEELCPESGPCPVSISEQELSAHADEQEVIEAMDKIIGFCEHEWEVSRSGRVHPAKYHEIRMGLKKKRDWLIENIEDETMRKHFAEVWPYE